MFITLTDSQTGKLITFNSDNIVVFGQGTVGGKVSTWFELVSKVDPNESPWFVDETPEYIMQLLKGVETK